MENWLLNFRQASYKGIEFYVERSEATFGRRQVLHEFPFIDSPYLEDMGRAAREFSFDAYVVGGSYNEQRDNLIKACESKGTGKLVHPYLGEYDVVSTGCKLVESSTEGRVARFSLTFTEQKILAIISVSSNTKADVYAKRKSAFQACQDWLDELYDIVQKPVGIIQNVLESMDKALALLTTAKKVVGSIADYKREISNVYGKLTQLVLDSNDMFNEFKGIVEFGTDDESQYAPSSTNAARQYAELKTVADSSFPVTDYIDTNNPEQMFGMMVKMQAFISMAGLLSTATFDSKQESESLMRDTRANFDSIINTVGVSPNVISALKDLQASVFADVDSRSATFGELFNVNVANTSENSLALAYSTYGNIDKEQDIVSRNAIANPFFITSARQLEVVVNE